ncbi:MAG: ribosome assembly cofactor RimP [Flavobacteriaceae bacterium]|jgi:ribosome maturation factor RimP|nr:ribosome assembly cofactor RimP [Flavobacteriaceae bacterium]
MIAEEKIKLLLRDFFDARPDLFLISCKISPDNKIEIVIDGDEHVSIQDCLDCSRAVENHLDRDEEDFELSVLSAGLSSPLQIPRQYRKNIGEELEVTLAEKKISGTLTEADDESISLEWTERRPKAVGKGKETVELKEKILYNDIKKAIIIIKF